MNVLGVYNASDADATRLLYARLEAIGPVGAIAMNLIRASKCSGRAKQYRRRIHSREAYDRKQWSLGNVCQALQEHATGLGIVWGWGEDRSTPGFSWVLYVEIPTGQVSFHSRVRGDGPDYPGEWDRQREASYERIVRWTQGILDTHPEVEAIQGPDRSTAVTSDTPMPWGAHKGKPLSEVPGDYWRWFRSQAWAEKWPALLEYARSLKEEAAA
jgi:uncharacterized protein (DUF3820 family)